MKRVFVLSILCLFTTIVFSKSGLNSYHGSKGNRLVVFQLHDSMATVEYCYINFKGSYVCKFDTLIFNQNIYTGKFSKVLVKNNDFIFKPENVLLHHGVPDSSFNKMRNLAYLQNIKLKYKTVLGWTGFKLDELNIENCTDKTSVNPEMFRKYIQLSCDSLIDLYTSIKTTGKFSKVLIQNCRPFPKTYLESSDSAEIFRIWKLLAINCPEKNNMLFYILQYPISALPVAFFNLDFGIFSTIIVYPALIGTEKFIINAYYSGSTFKVTFIKKNNEKDYSVIKIRNNVLIGENYNYSLPFNFAKEIFNKN